MTHWWRLRVIDFSRHLDVAKETADLDQDELARQRALQLRLDAVEDALVAIRGERRLRDRIARTP